MYGPEYENDLLVGDANHGNIYDFKLDEQRKKLHLSGDLADNIANNVDELEELIFAKGFGKVADMKIGPDGYLYVLSTQNDSTNLYRINP
jgi:aldose sugar dehydrogenase